MAARGKIASDVKKLIAEGIVGACIGAFILIFKPRPDFTRGLVIGYASGVLVLAAVAVVLRLLGRRKLGEMDEREAVVAGKAASVALTATVIALALFIMLAYSLPAVASVDPALLATGALVFISAVSVIAYLALNR